MKHRLSALLKCVLTILLLSSGVILQAQLPFEIELEPIEIEGVGGLQSYAFGIADGKWLIVGGRLDGLHRRQPWASFDVAGHNDQIIVIDPAMRKSWSTSLDVLPTGIKEQLSSTNMEFYQDGEYLYCLGGYGYSPTGGDHLTYDKLTAIHVRDVVEAITKGQDIRPFFRQMSDSKLQVTGGRLRKMYDRYYLLGGQKFMGRYNPMGPDHGPGFMQEYVDGVRVFQLEDDGTDLKVTHLPSYQDSLLLHRRDYNAEPQVSADGSESIVMFSGVFQHDRDVPFLNAVRVDSTGYAEVDFFRQKYNHYHCPSIPLFDQSANTMYNIFFGGIAWFYDKDGELFMDHNVPFVNTIAAVVCDSLGKMEEVKLEIEMPSLLGAGGEFIPNETFPKYPNGVLDLDEMENDRQLIGYLYGGISSSAPNIFFSNDGTQSEATSQIFEVYVSRTKIGKERRVND